MKADAFWGTKQKKKPFIDEAFAAEQQQGCRCSMVVVEDVRERRRVDARKHITVLPLINENTICLAFTVFKRNVKSASRNLQEILREMFV